MIPSYRTSEIYFPRVEQPQALVGFVEHFHAGIAARKRTIMDGGRAMRIIRMLTGAQNALDSSLKTTAELRSPRKLAALPS